MLNLSNDTISAKPGLQESQRKLVEVMSALQSFLIRHFGKESGARFSKVPIINGPGTLSPFTFKIEVLIVLHLT